jgi:TRAP-type C4-dicarboxylate transport system substrate-binding protein
MLQTRRTTFRKALSGLGIVSGAALTALLMAGGAHAQSIKLKYATYLPPQHAVSKWLTEKFKQVQEKAQGRLEITELWGGQLGPPPKYYDMVSNGQIDMTWFLTGNFPGVFKLTEVSNLPYLIGSAEIGAKVVNDPEFRKHLDKEYAGLRILNLHTHQPGNVFTAKKAVRSVADFKGVRLRFPSGPIRDLLLAVGGTPVGLPPSDVVESMQKGTLDGTVIDYGGAAFAFPMAPVTDFATELYAYVGSFCICMNKAAFDKLPADIQKIFADTFDGEAIKPGFIYDSLDKAGKGVMLKANVKPIVFSEAEDKKIRDIAEKVSVAHLDRLEKSGLPGRKVYETVKTLSAKYTPGSHSFWRK